MVDWLEDDDPQFRSRFSDREAPNRGSDGARSWRPSSASGRDTPSPSAYSQRVYVNAQIHSLDGSRTSSTGRLLDYMERDGAGRDGETPSLFNDEEDEVDRDAFTARADDDEHQFRIVLSPENAHEDHFEMDTFVRDWMDQVEKDLDHDLDWVAAVHENTDQPHAHIVIRGRDRDGEEVRIHPDYLNRGMRNRAREVATHQLGPRMEDDLARHYDRQIQANRVTEMDRAIARASDQAARERRYERATHADKVTDLDDVLMAAHHQADRDGFSVSDIDPKKPGLSRKQLHERVHYLEDRGLADRDAQGAWMLDDDLYSELDALEHRHEQLHAAHKTALDDRLVTTQTSDSGQPFRSADVAADERTLSADTVRERLEYLEEHDLANRLSDGSWALDSALSEDAEPFPSDARHPSPEPDSQPPPARFSLDSVHPHADGMKRRHVHARLQYLEQNDLAYRSSQGDWHLNHDALDDLRDLAERDKIARRMEHAGYTQSAEWTQASPSASVSGRVTARGVDHGLEDEPYYIVETSDGQARHVAAAQASDRLTKGDFVRLASDDDRSVTADRVADQDLEAAIDANGPTWLDRDVFEQTRPDASHDYGDQLSDALKARRNRLEDRGIVEDANSPPRDLVKRLRTYERDQLAAELAEENQLTHRQLTADDPAMEGELSETISLRGGDVHVLRNDDELAVFTSNPHLREHEGQRVSINRAPGEGDRVRTFVEPSREQSLER